MLNVHKRSRESFMNLTCGKSARHFYHDVARNVKETSWQTFNPLGQQPWRPALVQSAGFLPAEQPARQEVFLPPQKASSARQQLIDRSPPVPVRAPCIGFGLGWTLGGLVCTPCESPSLSGVRNATIDRAGWEHLREPESNSNTRCREESTGSCRQQEIQH